jgi:hypothetical protein
MSDERSRLADRAEALRLAFDRSFAEERRRDTPSNESLLAFDLGAEPYALRLSEIAGIFVVNGGAKPGQWGGVKPGHWRRSIVFLPRLPSGDARSPQLAQRVAAG